MFLESKQQSLKKITAISLAVLFFDQVIKFIVVNNVFFEVEIYRNYNALFGLPVNFGLVFILFVALIIFLSSLNFKKEISFEKATLTNVAFSKLNSFGLILGGILGNLTDRIFYGYIIDYLNLFNLFVFNIADLAISFGVLLLSWKVLKK